MNKYPFSELELRSRYISFLNGVTNISVYLEVPVFCRSVDLVLHDEKHKKLTAIEFKLHDWKKAIMQAQTVGICFDYLSICLPKPKTSNAVVKVTEACISNKVGLIFYDTLSERFETVVRSPMTSAVWKTQKEKIIKYLEVKSHESTNKNVEIQYRN